MHKQPACGLRGDLQQGLRTQLEQQREEARALETRLFDLRSEMENRLRAIEAMNEKKLEEMRVTVDGVAQTKNVIPLVDDRQPHSVEISLRAPTS